MTRDKDPIGAAIADFWKHGNAGRLRVFSPDFEEDEIPLETLFRNFQEMPALERVALERAQGKVLDVGAGAGCHSLVLQEMGKDVTAIDISPLAVDTMRHRGVTDVREQDFWTLNEKYDTILMLMNGIGIVGSVDALPRFFAHIDSLLNPNGQLIFDSSDISYLFDSEEDLPEDRYYGEVQFQMQYKRVKSEPFDWLYIDSATLKSAAEAHGFEMELLMEGEHYEYLACLRRA